MKLTSAGFIMYITVTLEASLLITENIGQWFKVESVLGDEFYYAKDCNGTVHILHKEDIIAREYDDKVWEAYCKAC